MGKQKKTRNKEKDRLKPKKKEKKDPSALKEREVPQHPSCLFFQYNTQLGPPYHILVDTNFINFSIKAKLDLVQSMMDCLYAKCRRYQHSLKCLPDPRSSLLTSIPFQPIVQSNPCLKSWLWEWLLSWAKRRPGGHNHWSPSSLSQTMKSGLFTRIWGLHPTALLLPQGFSVVLPVRAVISCSRTPSSSSSLRLM
ncbi:rRNA-processing protein FCF1 homolog isoform X3 [Elephas maximus indicus]|uniref:rRNA-processing protein FCF1 homolog isoform X3 n=1 Tax=Elephas maximus indicus TaxID=99487 RepID=UPI002115E04A|nr:rRNA-processing protein FCF1 homolog isoform X3 [Elephas maximus indicus]